MPDPRFQLPGPMGGFPPAGKPQVPNPDSGEKEKDGGKTDKKRQVGNDAAYGTDERRAAEDDELAELGDHEAAARGEARRGRVKESEEEDRHKGTKADRAGGWVEAGVGLVWAVLDPSPSAEALIVRHVVGKGVGLIRKGVQYKADDLVDSLTGGGGKGGGGSSKNNLGGKQVDKIGENASNGLARRGISEITPHPLMAFNKLKKLTQGTGLQRHHLIPERLLEWFPEWTRETAPAIALTPKNHQPFTNAWHDRIPRGTIAKSRKHVEDEARWVYREYPEILEHLGLRE